MDEVLLDTVYIAFLYITEYTTLTINTILLGTIEKAKLVNTGSLNRHKLNY